MRRFDDLHPAVLLIYFLAILIPVMVIMDGLMVIAAIVTGLIWQTMRKGRFPFGSFCFECWLILLVTAVNAVIYPHGGTVLFYIAGRAINWEGVAYGFRTGGMLVAALVWCDLLGQLLTGDSIQNLLSRMPKLALLMTMVLRLIPRYLKRYRDVEAANRVNDKTSSANAEGEAHRSSERVGMVLQTSAVFTWALENAAQTADSMEMRGFGNPKRTRLKKPVYKRDVIVLILIAGACAGYVVATWIPIAALGLFPIIYAGKEEIRWATHRQNY